MTQFEMPSKHGRRLAVAVAALALLAVASGAQAADKASAKTRATVLQGVLDCRAITDQAARLTCFDAAVARMDQAESAGDILVVDREQVHEAKRQAFGFEMPHFTLFDRGSRPETIDKISGVADSAYVNSEGKWTIVLEDGAKWVQVDNEPVEKAPHKGSKVEIRKASLGSFFMNLDGQRAVRARRVNN